VAGTHTLLSDGVVLGQQNTRGDPTAILGSESRSGPAGQLFATPAARNAGQVAVLGLRTGSLACYGTDSQRWSFYERDPAIVSAAEDPSRFTFLGDCPPASTVRLGLERQSLGHAPDHSFGVIVVRAANGAQPDPSLYTTDAMRLYVSKLAPGGILAFDVTLGALDLGQHVADAAGNAGGVCYARNDVEPSVPRLLAGVFPSTWIACGGGSADSLGAIRSDPRWHAFRENALDAWTDGRLPAGSALRLGEPPA
jgi:spermidine synthase